jgi:hypothetical protein
MELVEWTLAERMGWTLEYIDSLPLHRVHEWIQIEDGKAKARPKNQPRVRGRGGRR